MSLGKNIGYLRKQKKLTQEQLAEKMGVRRDSSRAWQAYFTQRTVFLQAGHSYKRGAFRQKRHLFGGAAQTYACL